MSSSPKAEVPVAKVRKVTHLSVGAAAEALGVGVHDEAMAASQRCVNASSTGWIIVRPPHAVTLKESLT